MKSETEFLEKGIMGNKRLKLVRGLGNFIPKVVNFSELEDQLEDQPLYNPGDDSAEQERIMNGVMYEELIVNILCNLEPREQIVFVFQLLRDAGYQIDHAAFAKTQHLSRRQFMRILEGVRQKSKLYILGYRQSER